MANGSIAGYPAWINNISPSGRVSQGSIGGRLTFEEKAARKIVELASNISFDANLFGYSIYQYTNDAVRARVMEMVVGIINQYAKGYAEGDYSEHAVAAKRIQDALVAFERAKVTNKPPRQRKKP